MLLLLLCIFSVHCHQRGQATFNKTSPSEDTDLMHKSIHEIDSLLVDFQQEIQKEKSILRAVDLEIHDVGVLDYSMTPVFWGPSPGSNLTGNHTSPTRGTLGTLFPFPPGHFKPKTKKTKDPWAEWELPGLEFSSKSPSIFLGPAPGHFPDFGYQLNQTPKFDKRTVIPPLYRPRPMNYSVSFKRPSFPFQISSTAPFSLEPYINYVHFNASYSPGSPTLKLPTTQYQLPPALRGLFATRTKTTTLSGLFATDLHKKAMRDRTRYWVRGQRQTNAYRTAATTRRPQLRKRTSLSKARAWVQNKLWMKTKLPGRNLQGNVRERKNEPDPKAGQPKSKAGQPESKAGPSESKAGQPVSKDLTKDNQVQNDPSNSANEADKGSAAKPAQGQIADDKAKPAESGDPTAPSVTFSVPGLSDILPSMSIPGLDDVTLYTPVPLVSVSSSTTPNPLIKVTTILATAFTEELLKEDDAGYLYVKSPSTIYVPPTVKTTNTLGQVLYNAENFTASTLPQDPHQSYHDLMDAKDEGYLTIFLLELARVIAHKEDEHVAEVMAHAEIIYYTMEEQGQLSSFGSEIVELGTKVSRMFSGGDIPGLQSYANMMHQLLSGRAQFLSAETNSVIDYADMLFEDDEGEELLEALRLFELYPNDPGKMGSYAICANLINKFIKPYRRLRTSDRFRKLADSILKLVKSRFSRKAGGYLATSRRRRVYRRSRDKAHTHTKRTTKKTHITTSLRQKIETRRYQIKHRRRRENQYKFRRQRSNIARRQDSNVAPTDSRNLLLITNHQRFKVVTPRQLRSNGYLNHVRPTVGYFKRRVGKPVHPQGGVLEMFPQVRAVEVRIRAQRADEEKTPKDSSPQQTPGTLKEEVRRIVEESSYSDEEDSLKMNLRHALRLNWHKTSTPSMNTTEVK